MTPYQLSPIYSADGSQVVYTGGTDHKALIYVNGVALPNNFTGWVHESRPVFSSPDVVDLLMTRDQAFLHVRLTLTGGH